ncbi:hypothetical protein CB1_000345036 [Camelus ferus]|nr:hypothetical protein CB1_000345036 [Camelus ferus]
MHWAPSRYSDPPTAMAAAVDADISACTALGNSNFENLLVVQDKLISVLFLAAVSGSQSFSTGFRALQVGSSSFLLMTKIRVFRKIIGFHATLSSEGQVLWKHMSTTEDSAGGVPAMPTSQRCCERRPPAMLPLRRPPAEEAAASRGTQQDPGVPRVGASVSGCVTGPDKPSDCDTS